VRDLRALFQQTTAPSTAEQARAVELARRAAGAYRRLIEHRGFHRVIVGTFLVHVVIAIVAVIALIVSDPQFTWRDPSIGFQDWGDTLATGLATLMVVIGVIRLRSSRLVAYYWFKRSLLVSIFLVQFFAFYAEQLTAVVGLVINLVILAGLDYMIGQERAVHAAELTAGAEDAALGSGGTEAALPLPRPLTPTKGSDER
jgi:hypothetical protein